MQLLHQNRNVSGLFFVAKDIPFNLSFIQFENVLSNLIFVELNTPFYTFFFILNKMAISFIWVQQSLEKKFTEIFQDSSMD